MADRAKVEEWVNPVGWTVQELIEETHDEKVKNKLTTLLHSRELRDAADYQRGAKNHKKR